MNSNSFLRFHNDLKAALVAGIPLELGSAGSGIGKRLTIDRLSQIEKVVAPSISEEDSSVNTIKSLSKVPARYAAAFQVFERTDSMPIVLDGLTTRGQARFEATRTLRWTFIYLFFLLVIAFAGLWLYTWRVLPMLALMRADLLLAAAVNAPPQFDPTPWFPLLVYLLGGTCFLFLILILSGGSTTVAMWLGGNQYLRCRLSTFSLRLTQILSDGGMPKEEAVAVACELSGADAKVRRKLQDTIADSSQAQNLESLADYLTLAGSDRLAHMGTTSPIVLVSVIGGAVALFYCLAVFWPIISILKDMTTLGT